MHHMLFCAMYAYGLQRTLIVNSSNWRYNKAGWDAVFLPVSETCAIPTGKISSFHSESFTCVDRHITVQSNVDKNHYFLIFKIIIIYPKPLSL